MSKAYGRFLGQNVIFATSALICKGGYRHYLRGEIGNEDVEKCQEDGPDGDRMLEELLFASTIDNFNTYLSEILVEVIETDPRPIAGKKFSAKQAFTTSDIETLRKQIIEKFVLDLGYQNIDSLTEFLQENFGLKTLDHWLTKARLNRYIQIRNIITHNRGYSNQTYLFRSKSKVDVDGEKVFVPFALTSAKYLGRLVDKLDKEIDRKFFSREGGGKSVD